MTWSCTIPVAVPSMKNARRVGFHHGHRAWIRSEACLEFEKIAIPMMRLEGLACDPGDALAVDVMVRYPNWRRDLDAELIYDCLQKAGVIDNDRQIVRKLVQRDWREFGDLTLVTVNVVGRLPYRKKGKDG